MSGDANRIVQKLWLCCNVLRDDGLSYQDYLEQLTLLLFLKMADDFTDTTIFWDQTPAGRWLFTAHTPESGETYWRRYE